MAKEPIDKTSPEYRDAKAAIEAERKRKLTRIGKGRKFRRGDRVFKVGNREWRARVLVNPIVNTAPASDPGDQLLPAGYGIVVSVSLLDGDHAARDAAGNAVVFSPTSRTFQTEQLTRGDFDPETAILEVVAERIEDAEKELANREKLATALTAWTDDSVPSGETET